MYKQISHLHNFIQGLGSIMNIFPSPHKSVPYSSFHTDLISFKKDWNAIGKDFSNVCRSLEKEQKIFKSISKDRKKMYKALNIGQETCKHI